MKLPALLILVAFGSFSSLHAQKSQTAPTRQSSVDAFNRGSYEDAYAGFSQLLLKYPKDPLYRYYTGACLVMMKKDPEAAVNHLEQSVSGATVVRTLPDDAYFYLGRARQMAGRFNDAIEAYNTYTEQVGKKVARDQDVPSYIQECQNKKGMIAASAYIPVTTTSAEKPQKDAPAVKKAETEQVKPVTEAAVREQERLPEEYERILDEALRLQYKADSLNMLVSEQKAEVDKLPDSSQASMRMKISQNELLAAEYQKSADKKYSEAQERMNNKNTAGKIEENRNAAITVAAAEPVRSVSSEVKSADSVPPPAGTVVPEQKQAKSVAVYSLFEILPGDAVYPDEKIRIDPEIPSGLVYRIQIAVFRNPVAPAFFKGITPVYGLRVAGTDKTAYYAGMFRRSADARLALQKVKDTGFKDAFIVAVSDSKAISSDRAAVLENEWANIPLFNSSLPGMQADTIPPTLAFRVEVIRSAKPLKADVVENMKATAGSRGLDIVRLTDGSLVYLIGKFITFESAAEYADLLVRNNYRNAKVVAWLGNKEIPVDTARQLFDDLE